MKQYTIISLNQKIKATKKRKKVQKEKFTTFHEKQHECIIPLNNTTIFKLQEYNQKMKIKKQGTYSKDNKEK